MNRQDAASGADKTEKSFRSEADYSTGAVYRPNPLKSKVWQLAYCTRSCQAR